MLLFLSLAVDDSLVRHFFRHFITISDRRLVGSYKSKDFGSSVLKHDFLQQVARSKWSEYKFSMLSIGVIIEAYYIFSWHKNTDAEVIRKIQIGCKES